MIRRFGYEVIMTVLITLLVITCSVFCCCAADDQAKICYSVDEAGEALRSAMKDRSESAGIWLITDVDASDAEDLMHEIFSKAIEHTGDPCEGDYLKFQYYDCKALTKTVWENGTEGILFTYSISYYDTAEQEEQLDDVVTEIISSLDLDDKTEYEKVECIYDYLCDHVEYDYDNLEDNEYLLKYTAYAALVDGKAVCQGYAEALYRLLLEAGIDNRIISGTAVDSFGDEESHAWNIVRMEDAYYNTDVTNDSELVRKKHFLKGTGSFNDDHVRAEEYDSDEFNATYQMGEKDYKNPDGGFLNDVAAFSENVKTKAQEMIGVCSKALNNVFDIFR